MMKHWRIETLPWDRFDASKIDPAIVPLIKAAAMVERNGADYAVYLHRVFSDDADFRAAADNWAMEEVQHGNALGQWATLADPGWEFETAFARYKNGYKIALDAEASIRGSRTGELIARCMVETGTSSYYTALADATEEPVLKEICRRIAADEFRHFKLFYDHMRRYVVREKLGLLSRFRVAVGRVGESEDDELAYAFHCANHDPATPYVHAACRAGYLGGAMGFYRFRHIERATAMMLKSIGLSPRGRLLDLGARLGWCLLRWRHRRFLAQCAAHPRAA